MVASLAGGLSIIAHAWWLLWACIAIVVLAIPLLTAMHRETVKLQLVVVVDCPLETAIDRLVGQRGFSRPDAEARIAAQASREERREGADFVIDNSNGRAQLAAEVDRVWAALAARGTPAP